VQVEVHLYGELGKRKGASLTLALAPDSAVSDLVRALGLSPEELGPVFVDGRYVKLTRPLHGGERVAIFPTNMSLLYVEVSYEAQDGDLRYVPRRDLSSVEPEESSEEGSCK